MAPHPPDLGRARALLPGPRRPSLRSGVIVASSAVAVATGIIYPLRLLAPVVSLGVIYLLAVLLVSTYWGLWLGLATSLASAAAFNFCHLPPTGRFTLADSRDWVALGAFAVVAVATSGIADLARSRAIEADARRRDSDLAANLARLLLGPIALSEAAPLAAHRIALAVEIPFVAIELAPVAPGPRRVALALRDEGRTLARLAPVGHAHINPLGREKLQAELVTTEALRQSDELKTALLRAVSHDLRTPLTAIHTAGHALAGSDLEPGEREELAGAIIAESERLSDLVEKLLDLSRLQAEPHATNASECSLDEPLLSAQEHVGGDIHLALDDDLPPIQADPIQLERAFVNLLENAVRHGAGHPVVVRARTVGPRLITRIVDHGPGIPPAEQQRIFEPFYRSSDSHRGGAGLGLAIAKGLIEANAGTLGPITPRPGRDVHRHTPAATHTTTCQAQRSAVYHTPCNTLIFRVSP
jgi:two-component system sensor histidine kinase KdpD